MVDQAVGQLELVSMGDLWMGFVSLSMDFICFWGSEGNCWIWTIEFMV